MEEEAKNLLPLVYKDLAGASARRLGRTLVSAVNTALRPADGVLWTINQAFDWIADAVSRRLEYRGVPKSRITNPPGFIEGRVLQGLQVTGPSDEPQLRNMFSALLATAMDKKTSDCVHPAMVTALGQMLPDEARFLSVIASRQIVVIEASNLEGKDMPSEIWSYYFYDDVPLSGVTQDSYWAFIESLKHLGLIQVSDLISGESLLHMLPYPEIGSILIRWKNFAFQYWHDRGWERTEDLINKLIDMIQLRYCNITGWGRLLADACAAEEFYSDDGYVMPEWAK